MIVHGKNARMFTLDGKKDLYTFPRYMYYCIIATLSIDRKIYPLNDPTWQECNIA